MASMDLATDKVSEGDQARDEKKEMDMEDAKNLENAREMPIHASRSPRTVQSASSLKGEDAAWDQEIRCDV